MRGGGQARANQRQGTGTDPGGRRPVRWAGITLAVVIAAGSVAANVAAQAAGGLDAPSPASGQAQVIAHGLMRFPEHDYWWAATREPARPGGPAGGWSIRPTSFLLIDK